MNTEQLRLLRASLCIVADGLLLLLHKRRAELAAIHPKEANLQRLDELIAELEELYESLREPKS